MARCAPLKTSTDSPARRVRTVADMRCAAPPLARLAPSISRPIRGACACGGTCPRCAKSSKTTRFAAPLPEDRALERDAERLAERAANQARIGTRRDAAAVAFSVGVPLSDVRIHADSASAAASHALRAHAFTIGADIFFGRGRYHPETRDGARLLAHELAHVAQQARHGTRLQRSPYDEPERGTEAMHSALSEAYADSLNLPNVGALQYTEGYQRWLQSRTASSVSFLAPTFRRHNPLDRLGTGQPTGYTDLTVNGISINPPGGTLNNYLTNLQNQLTPAAVTHSAGLVTGQVACRFATSFKVETSTVVDEASPAPVGGWTANLPPATVGAAAACPGKATVPVTLRGQPSDGAYAQLVHDSEMEHVNDLRTLHDRHLVPYYHFVTRLSATAGSNGDCEHRLRAQLGKRPEQASIGFALADLAEARKLDDPTSTHLSDLTPTVSAGCGAVTLVARQRNAPIPGAGAGNVQVVAPVRTAVDPLRLSVSGATLMSGGTAVRAFASTADAATAMGIFASLGVDEILRIGQVEIVMRNGSIASGSLTGIAGRAIDPARYQITVGVPNLADWVISQVEGDQWIELVNFHARRDDAYSAVALLRQHQARRQSWIGPAANPQMVFFTA